MGEPAEQVNQYEIRTKHDRNRLLGTYDPGRRVLRLYHRGEVVVVDINKLDGASPIDKPPSS